MNIKLVSAIGLCGFSVVAFTVSTIAWFTYLSAQSNYNEGLTVLSPSGYFKSMKLYDVVNIDYRNNLFQFNSTPAATATYQDDGTVLYSEGFGISMDTYDDLSQNHPILMVVQLKEEITATSEYPVNVFASSTSTEYFALANEDGTLRHQIQREGNPLSSIVAFYSKGMLANDPLLVASGSFESYTTFDYPIPEFTDSGFDRETFVDFDEDTMEYRNFTQNKNIYRTETETLEYVAIILDYYHPAVSYVYSTFLSEEVLDDVIYFSCDWSMVI